MTSMLPSLLLSGFMFPIDEHARGRSRRSPRSCPGGYYIRALRGVFLKGNGVEQLAPERARARRASPPSCWRSPSRRFRRRLG